MELLLWMWFYDSRWFFNFKISVKCYQNAWFIPLIIHLMLAGFCFVFMPQTETSSCEVTIKLWLLSRFVFSVLISINIIVFMFKISRVYHRENSFFENAKRVYPSLEEHLNEYDFWIRRKSLISTPGVLLLFLGIISLFWSYVIIKLYYFDNKFNGCGDGVLSLLNFNSILIFVGNFPIIIVILVLVLVKATSFLSAYLCPNFLIWTGKFFSSNNRAISEKIL